MNRSKLRDLKGCVDSSIGNVSSMLSTPVEGRCEIAKLIVLGQTSAPLFLTNPRFL
jgi:hypothetical protein